MAHLPDHMLNGYRNFITGSYVSERDHYPLAGAGGTGAGDHGDRLLRLPLRAGGHLRFRAGRTVRRAQRRQSGAALHAGRRIPLHLGGAGICRAEPQGEKHRGDGAWPLRRHPCGARPGCRAVVAGRFHRQMDEPRCAGNRSRIGQLDDDEGRAPDRARTHLDPLFARQLADISLRTTYWRARGGCRSAAPGSTSRPANSG